MGEAKRRKQVLGDSYGQGETVNQIIVTAKKNNDAQLPPGFLPDFGLEVAAQIGALPIRLTILEHKKIKILRDAHKGRATITCVPSIFSITSITKSISAAMVTRETMMALEIYDPDMSKVDTVIEALKSGVDIKANWSKRFWSQNPLYRELVVPIHLMPDTETRLGLEHIADYT